MSEIIKSFEKHLKEEEKSYNTIGKYLSDIDEFYNWLEFRQDATVKSVDFDSIVTKEILLEYKEYLKKTILKVSTINSKISSLNSFISYTQNENFKLKVLKSQKQLFESTDKELTMKEFHKLYDASKKLYILIP